MGHVSTLDYYSRIVRLFQSRESAVRNEDFPRVCIQGIAGADNVESLSDGNLRSQLTQACALLAESGVEVIGVPCNTVHNLMPAIVAQMNIPFLDMIKATRKKLDEERPPVCVILATRRTLANNAYSPRERTGTIAYVDLSQEQQILVDWLILRVNAGDSIEMLIPRIRLVTDGLPTDTAVVLGCTELSGFAPYLRSQGRLVIDSLEELVSITYTALSRR
jgi:aspartate/glutamate racemase